MCLMWCKKIWCETSIVSRDIRLNLIWFAVDIPPQIGDARLSAKIEVVLVGGLCLADNGLGLGLRRRILLLRLIQEVLHLLDGFLVLFLEVGALLYTLEHSSDLSGPHYPSIWPEIFPEVKAAVQGMATVAIKTLLTCLALALCLLSLKGRSLEGRCGECCRGVRDQIGLVPEDLGNLKAVGNLRR
jgi:hypothetical protein